jgi:hypothetical protein
MTKINLITAPDKLLNKAISIAVIHPKNETIAQVQNTIANWEETVNIYLYNPEVEEEVDVKWMLELPHICDYVIADLDNFDTFSKNFASYIISFPNVFYLTNDELTPYNIISSNRIFSVDWIFEREE